MQARSVHWTTVNIMERTPTPGHAVGSAAVALRDLDHVAMKRVSRSLFKTLDADGNGAIERDEFEKLGLSGNRSRKAWKSLDSDQNGNISQDEFDSFFAVAAADSEEAEEDLQSKRRTQLAWMVEQMELDLNRLAEEVAGEEDEEEEEEEEEEEDEDDEDEMMRVHRKPPKCVRNLQKWLTVDFEGKLLNATKLEAAVVEVEREGGADPETIQEAKRLLADPARRRADPLVSNRDHNVAFGDQVLIRFDEPGMDQGQVSMTVQEATVAEKDARLALGSVRKMGKHLEEYGTSKQKGEKASAWNKVMNDVDQVRARYHSRRAR